MGVIGVIGAIAMPQYSTYRKRAYDSQALHDIQTAATGEEAYYADNESYVDCIGAAACTAALPGFKASKQVNIAMYQVLTATEEYFTGRSFHPNGNKSSLASAYNWNSAEGGLQ